MENQEINILEILAYDKHIILYRPELNVLTNHIPTTLLLQQIIYWWFKNDRKKFYKFKVPPEAGHKLYKKGDSWCEELGLTSKVFDNAIKTIGFKLGKTKNLIKKEEALVIYYTDRDRLTWYELNEDLLNKKLLSIYKQNDRKEVILPTDKKEVNYQNDKKEVNYQNDKKEVPFNTETTLNTKITSKTTKDILSSKELDLITPIKYLNEKTGKNFSPSCKGTIRLIRARYNEGRTLEDFKRVIDKKCKDWLNDAKMKIYLRPSTLFSETNFENYINETDETYYALKDWRGFEDYVNEPNKRRE